MAGSLPALWLVMMVLAAAVQVYVGGTFYRSAWAGLKHGSSNMSLLVVLGTTSAFTYSLVSLVRVRCITESSKCLCYVLCMWLECGCVLPCD